MVWVWFLFSRFVRNDPSIYYYRRTAGKCYTEKIIFLYSSAIIFSIAYNCNIVKYNL